MRKSITQGIILDNIFLLNNFGGCLLLDCLRSPVDPELVVSLVLHVVGVRPKLLLELFAGPDLNFIILDI